MSQVCASTLTWNLEGVTFLDGGTATGSFGFDADTGNFSNINIVTTTGGLYGVTIYSAIGNHSNDVNLDLRSPVEGSNTQHRITAALAGGKLTNAGGIIALQTIYEVLCTTASCLEATLIRQVTTGSIVASPVPLPATLPLMISALGAFGYLGWRRRRLNI